MTKKISAVPSASALDGTELIPCIQGSNDRHMTPADLLAYMADNITLEDVIGVNRHSGSSVPILDYSTASRAAVINASKELMASIVTIAELENVGGSTSNIQTQIDSMVSLLNSLNTTVTDLNSSFQKIPTKLNCRVAATGNVALGFPGGVIDTVNINANDRILLPFQADPKENGIYYLNLGGTLTHTVDFQAPYKVAGCVVLVEEGATYADTIWQCTNDEPVNFGADNILFEEVDDMVGAAAPAGVTAHSGPGNWYGDASAIGSAMVGLANPDAWGSLVDKTGQAYVIPLFVP